jgi:hypothetical protein
VVLHEKASRQLQEWYFMRRLQGGSKWEYMYKISITAGRWIILIY